MQEINNVGKAFWLLAKHANMALIISTHTIAINLQEIQSKSTMSEIRMSLNIYLYHYKDHSLTGLGLQKLLYLLLIFHAKLITHFNQEKSMVFTFSI